MSEKIRFKIGLSGTYWSTKRPEYSVALSGGEVARGFIAQATDTTEFIEFETELEDGAHRLEIGFLNKVPETDVLKNSDNTIAQDFLLNIDSIEIDDIDLGPLRHTASRYEFVKKQIYNGEIIDHLTKCVNLGFNGTYIIDFKVPFYLWLLEQL